MRGSRPGTDQPTPHEGRDQAQHEVRAPDPVGGLSMVSRGWRTLAIGCRPFGSQSRVARRSAFAPMRLSMVSRGWRTLAIGCRPFGSWSRVARRSAFAAMRLSMVSWRTLAIGCRPFGSRSKIALRKTYWPTRMSGRSAGFLPLRRFTGEGRREGVLESRGW